MSLISSQIKLIELLYIYKYGISKLKKGLLFIKNRSKEQIIKSMKNIELYRTIQALVEAKKQQYTPTEPSFAHEYCKKQIQRKKLIPYNPRSKMSKIMKNFNQLDTYVNVEQLFQYIDMKNMEKQKQGDKNIPALKWKSKQKVVFNDQQLIGNIRDKLGPYNQRTYTKQNYDMLELIDFLEGDSNIATFRRRNSPQNDYLNFYDKNTKVQEEKDKFQSQKKQKWKYYDGGSYVFEDSNLSANRKKKSQPQIQHITNCKQSLKDRQKKMELIHQVTTYLQIILENHHKKKWGYKRIKLSENSTVHETPAQLKIEEAKQETKQEIRQVQKLNPKKGLKVIEEKQQKSNEEKSIFKQSKLFRNGTRHTDHRSLGQKSLHTTAKSSLSSKILTPLKTSMYNSLSTSQSNSQNFDITHFLTKKVHVKQNFTFRNRNIKQNLLKKVNAFLQFVQSEQKQFKRQKNSSIDLLDYLEKKQYIDNQMGCIDDQELQAVQNIVHLQR